MVVGVATRQLVPPAARVPGAPVAVGLDADAIVAAALELVDDRGLDAFTIRALGERLGVRAPTIYWHVGTKADLLEAVVDRVMVEAAPPVHCEGSWDARVRHLFAVVREQVVAHPRVMALMRSTHSRAFELWIGEALDIARAAGFAVDDAPAYARIMVTTALACAQSEVTIRSTDYMEVDPGDPSGRRYRVKPDVLRDDLPSDIALTTSYDVDEQHDRMTSLFVAGLGVELERSRPRRRRRARNSPDD
jgi:AcrR family transcriptional regulator